MPNIKSFVFTQPTVLETGPFHFVMDSHEVSAAKAKWIYDRSRTFTSIQAMEGISSALRHVDTTQNRTDGGWCHASRDCLKASYAWQQRDLIERYGFSRPKPILVEAGTLVVADTSGLHFRGLGRAGGKRASMGMLYEGCGRGMRRMTTYSAPLANVPRVPVLACANGTGLDKGCINLYARSLP